MSAAPQTAGSAKRGRKPGTVGPRVEAGSHDARRLACLILEVLGGLRTPTDASKVLGVSTQRYYGLEAQALAGLIHACERRSPGRQRKPDDEVASLTAKVAQLERECARRLALLRASQRTLGLSKPAEPTKDAAGKRRRRPAIRALKAAAELDKPVVRSDHAVS